MNEEMNLTESLPPHLLERLKLLSGEPLEPSGPERDTHTETPEEAAQRRMLKVQARAARWQNNLPPMYAAATLDSLDAAQAEAGAKARTWWNAQDASTLILAGSVGTGKTYLAYALGNMAAARGLWVEAWTVADLLEDLRPNGDRAADRRARNCDVLILDDLAALNVTPWAAEHLTAILDSRVAGHRRQIVTTNVPSQALEDAWKGRFMDRLNYHSVVATMVGESRRRGAW